MLVFGGAMHVDQEDRHGWLHDERLLLQRLARGRGAAPGRLPRRAARRQGARRARPPHAQPRDRLARGRAHSRGRDPTRSSQACPAASPPSSGTCTTSSSRRARWPLARNERCLQAFRAGTTAWAIQFHAEVTRESVLDWLHARPTRRRTALSTSRASWPRREERIGAWNAFGRELCGRFLDVAGS